MLLKEADDNRKAIAEYQLSLYKQTSSLETLRHDLLEKDAKVEML